MIDLLLANQIWACEYIKPIARLVTCLTDKKPFPRAKGWGSLKKKFDYDDLKDMLRKLRRKEVNMHPWGTDQDKLPTYVRQSSQYTKSRVLLDGPCGPAWYLGERVSVQSLGLISPRVPKVPPPSMLGDYPITKEVAKSGFVAVDALEYLEPDGGPNSYRDFVKRHIRFKKYLDDTVSLSENYQ